MSNLKIDLHYKLKKQVNERLESNPQLSLRALSKKMNISISALSQYLNGNRNLSMENIVKVIDWMNLEGKEKDSLLFSELSELSKDPQTKKILGNKIDNVFIEFCPLQMIKNSELKLKASYYNHDRLCFRTLYVYQEIDPPNYFYITEIVTIPDHRSFVQAFIQQHKDGHTLYRSECSGENFRKILTKNPMLTVELSEIFYPTIHHMPLLSATLNWPAIATLQFSEEQLSIDLTNTDTSAEFSSIIYRRID